jgi:hypothetical protein
MRKLIFVLTMLTALFSAAITVARHGGSRVPTALDAYLSQPDGSPCPTTCLYGVSPGKIRFVEAERLLRTHPALRGRILLERNNGFLTELFTVNHVITLIRGPDNTLDLVSVRYTDDSGVIIPADWPDQPTYQAGLAPLGDALYRFGPPDRVSISRNRERTARFFYLAQGVIITTDAVVYGESAHLDISDRVVYIGISAPETYRNGWGGLVSGATHWGGFSHIRRYMRSSR